LSFRGLQTFFQGDVVPDEKPRQRALAGSNSPLEQLYKHLLQGQIGRLGGARNALRQDGISAPFVVYAPMNGQIFLSYLEQCLVPTLSPGEIVSMDNLPDWLCLARAGRTPTICGTIPATAITTSWMLLRARSRSSATRTAALL
jgi:hypothetical protein